MPWPQLAYRAAIETPSGLLDVINVHIPNGSGNGWKKVDSLIALAEALESSPDAPRLLAGDFNEPRAILESGEVVTFGQLLGDDGTVRLGRRGSRGARFTDNDGDHDLQDWANAVLRIFSTKAQHKLRHVHGLQAPAPVTHVIRGQERFFDHMFLSDHLACTQHQYDDSVRQDGLSDHALLWADISLSQRTAQPLAAIDKARHR